MLEQLSERNDLLQRSAALRKSEELAGEMRRMLRRLAGFREEPKEASRVRRRFDLGQTDVSGDHGEDIIQIVRDATRQRAERFQFARRQALGFGFLPFADVPEKDRNPAVARIRVHFVPDLPGGIARLELHWDLLRHDLPKIGFEDRAGKLGKFFPKFVPEQLVAGAAKQRFRLRRSGA